MAIVYFGAANTTWQTVANWYTNTALTTPYGSIPLVGDTVYFIAGSGNCTLAADSACKIVDFRNGGTAYTGTFDMGTYRFRFTNRCTLNIPAQMTLTQSVSSVFVADLSFSSSFFRTGGQTIERFELLDSGDIAFSAAITADRNFIIKNLDIINNGVSDQNLDVGGLIDGMCTVQNLSIVQNSSGKLETGGATGINQGTLLIEDNVDFNFWVGMFGSMKLALGGSASVTATLHDTANFTYHDVVRFLNTGNGDIIVTLVTNIAQRSQMRVGAANNNQGIRFETEGTGKLTVDATGADISPSGTYYNSGEVPFTIEASKLSTGQIEFLMGDGHWGVGSKLTITNFDLITSTNAGFESGGRFELIASTSGFPATLVGVGGQDFPVPLVCYGLGFLFTIQFSNAFVFKKDVAITSGTGGHTSFLPGAHAHIFEGELLIDDALNASAGLSVTWNTGTYIFRGDFLVRATTTYSIQSSTILRLEPLKGQGQKVIGGTPTTAAGNGLLEVAVQENSSSSAFSCASSVPAVGAPCYSCFDIILAGVGFEIGKLKVILLDEDVCIGVDPGATLTLGASSQSIFVEAQSILNDVCGNPASWVRANFISTVAGLQWSFDTPNHGNPYVSFAALRGCTMATSILKANDGTCVDLGNNSFVTFTAQAYFLCAPAPDPEFVDLVDGPQLTINANPEYDIEMVAFKDWELVPTLRFDLVDFGTTPMTGTADVVNENAIWLAVTALSIAEDIDPRVVLDIILSNFGVGVLNESFDIQVNGTEPNIQIQRLNVQLTISLGPDAVLDQSSLAQLVIAGDLASIPAADVVNISNGNGGVDVLDAAQISVEPVWLDVVLGGAGDAQTVSLQPNALAVALPPGEHVGLVRLHGPSTATTNWVRRRDITVTLTVTPPPELSLDNDALNFQMLQGGSLPGAQLVIATNTGSGDIGTITATPLNPEVEATVSPGELGDHIEVALTSSAMALPPGTHSFQVEVEASGSGTLNNPDIIDVSVFVLGVEDPPPFRLSVAEIQFEPDEDWTVDSPQTFRVIAVAGIIIAPVTIPNLPFWLTAQIDATNLQNQLVTLTVPEVPTDPDQLAVLLQVQGLFNNPGLFTVELPVEIITPAFFRREDCFIPFIERIEGDMVLPEDCEVPPLPPVLPPDAPPPPPPPGGGGGCYEMEFIVGLCLEGSITFINEFELGKCKPKLEVKHQMGCLTEGVYTGPGSGIGEADVGEADTPDEGDPTNDDWVVTAIEVDECGHICNIWFEKDDHDTPAT